jgi:hypothetical protein
VAATSQPPGRSLDLGATGVPIAVTTAEASAGSSTRPEGGRLQRFDHRSEALALVAIGEPIAVTMAEALASSPARPEDGRRQCLDHRSEAATWWRPADRSG